MAASDQWYYNQRGTAIGPVPMAVVRQLIAAGQLGPADIVWCEGMEQWTPAGRVPELFPSSQSPGDPFHAPPAGPATTSVPYAAAYGQPQQPGQSSMGFAIAGFVLAFFFAPLGLIFSAVALHGMKKSGNPEGKGLAIAGVIVSALFTLGWCVWFALMMAFISAAPHMH